jgi:hypothetical protein
LTVLSDCKGGARPPIKIETGAKREEGVGSGEREIFILGCKRQLMESLAKIPEIPPQSIPKGKEQDCLPPFQG